MSEMKGQSLSIWIWIIGGIVTASLLILISQTSLVQLGEQTSRQQVVQDFNGLNNDISTVCRMSTESQRNTEMSMNSVRAVFAHENRSEAPIESPILIANGNTSQGENVCMSFEDDHYGCVQHSCPVNVTYMGVPQEGSDAYTLGEESGFQYDISISKQRDNSVRVDGNIVP